ncbi:MAG: autotransporter-associated beta strand repeat-containing protein [bacterium]
MKNKTVVMKMLCLILIAPLGVMAADRHKKDNNDNLNTTTSWVEGAVPGNTDIAIWDATVATPANCTNTASTGFGAVKGIVVSDPASDVRITQGTTVAIGTNGIVLSGTRDLYLSMGGNIFNLGTGAQTWNIASGRTVTIDSTKPYFWSGSLQGKLTLTGAGTVVFTNGTPAIGYNSAIKSNTLEIVDSTLRLYSGLWVASSGTGVVYQTGGTVDLRNMCTLGGGNAAVASYDLAGGQFSSTANLNLGLSFPNTGRSNSIARFTVREAGAALVRDILMGGSRNTNGTMTLTLKTGGTLSANSITTDVTAVDCALLMEFDGGILKPTGNNATFFNAMAQAAGSVGTSKATLSANGAVIDTAGYNVTIAQPLADADGQVGRLVKLGAGTLTLTNAHTFTGPVVVSNGTLRVASNATLASTNWVIAAGATNTFDSAVSLAGKNVTIDAGGSVNPGLLDVTGTLTLGGKLTVVNTGDRQKIAQCTGVLSGDFDEVVPKGYIVRKIGDTELWLIKIKGTLISVL